MLQLKFTITSPIIHCLSNSSLVSVLIIVKRLLVKINNDLLLAADSGLLTMLVLLNLNVAFDTIAHKKLLDRLISIGITGPILR